MLATPCDFGGRQLGEAAGELAVVAATGVLVAATAQNLAQDQESYVTPATDVPGSIVLQDPVVYANQVQVTGTPLDSGDLPTIPPPMQPVGITTQQLVTPLPQNQNAGDLIVAASRPSNLAPSGAGRQGAFRQAKRDAGIPVSQQPDGIRLVPDRTNPSKMVREYDFGEVTIQDHRWGHSYRDDPTQNRGRHFNLRPGGGHYDYE